MPSNRVSDLRVFIQRELENREPPLSSWTMSSPSALKAIRGLYSQPNQQNKQSRPEANHGTGNDHASSEGNAKEDEEEEEEQGFIQRMVNRIAGTLALLCGTYVYDAGRTYYMHSMALLRMRLIHTSSEFAEAVSMQVSLSLNLGLKGILLYTACILCTVECCIRQLWCSSIMLYNITSIAYNHYTDIYPLSNT